MIWFVVLFFVRSMVRFVGNLSLMILVLGFCGMFLFVVNVIGMNKWKVLLVFGRFLIMILLFMRFVRCWLMVSFRLVLFCFFV